MNDETVTVARLEALGDPNRFTLLDELIREQNPLDSGELGRRVKSAKVTLSYHLEVLERAGLVVQVGDDLWAASAEPMVLTPEMGRDPRFKRLYRMVEQAINDRRAERAQRWTLNRGRSMWADWVDSTISRDYVLPGMTPADLEELDRRLDELAQEFKARGQTAIVAGVEGAEVVTLTLFAHPLRGAD